MQELLLIEEVFNLVEKGVKHSTLRKGKRDITTGLLTFKMTESPDIQTLVMVNNSSKSSSTPPRCLMNKPKR